MWGVIIAIGYNIKRDRYKVAGGWIVWTFKPDEYDSPENRTFVSDPNHKWKMYMKESFNA